MPWYYAGPEAKPVGPLSLDELLALRERGVVKPDTYIIEQSGQPVSTLAWRRCQDVFPVTAAPPLPPPAVPPAAATVPPVAPAPPLPLHPLFPSATAGAYPVPPHPTVLPGRFNDPYYNVKPTNPWCGWGFGLGLAAPILAFVTCGLGGILGLPALILCIVGLAQVHKRREQTGQGLAIAGLVLSSVGLVISIVVLAVLAVPMIKAHELTVTEQTSNDSE
jgi:hypothetical protein